MSISIIWGAPGEGKTLFAFRKLQAELLSGRHVYTNIAVTDKFRAAMIERQVDADLFHQIEFRKLAEGETKPGDGFASWLLNDAIPGSLIVADECHQFFPTSDQDEHKLLGESLRQHRKLGFDILLVTQFPGYLSKRVRDVANYSVEVKNLATRKIWGLFPMPPNIIAYWRARSRDSGACLWREPFTIQKRDVEQYDSFALVEFAEKSQVNTARPTLNRGLVITYATAFVVVGLVVSVYSAAGKLRKIGKRVEAAEKSAASWRELSASVEQQQRKTLEKLQALEEKQRQASSSVFYASANPTEKKVVTPWQAELQKGRIIGTMGGWQIQQMPDGSTRKIKVPCPTCPASAVTGK